MQTGNTERMRMRCIVVDDEAVARRGLRRELEKSIQVDVVGEANSISSFQRALTDLNPDLVFLDIMLCEDNIFEHISSSDSLPMIVFITAYPDFGYRGFEIGAVDYLLKPVAPHNLQRSLNKAHSIYLRNQNISDGKLWLRSNGNYHLISLDDILFIEGMQNYIKVHCTDQMLLCKTTLQSVLQILPARMFLRTHRSFIINREKIDLLASAYLRISGHRIPISREAKKEIHAILLESYHKLNDDGKKA